MTGARRCMSPTSSARRTPCTRSRATRWRATTRRQGRTKDRCEMQGAVLYGARDIRFEDRAEPTIVDPTDAIISLPVTCICGSDLWPYRGVSPFPAGTPMGHEYCGYVEEVGRGVTSLKRGQFVIGSFFASDNTCPHCQYGYQTSCEHKTPVGGAQAPRLRVPLADGTLVATRDVPDADHIPSMLALSDVTGTGWFAADAANVKRGSTVVVVGDGAVGLLGVLSAKHMGAERIIAMSRHETRQKLAREFGATDVVTERGEEGVARVKELTKGVGADSALECVGNVANRGSTVRNSGWVLERIPQFLKEWVWDRHPFDVIS